MLKKVTMKNFESHEDTEVEFTDGLNLLIGGSNQGKSSIIRAIAMVVANRFDKDEVRNGKDFCEVTLETDKGKVTARRGESVNQWITQKTGEDPKEYKNIGLDVPPETMEILGMGEVSHGEIEEMPNIMFQLEKHYMLSEIDGKKSTSNMIARMMDEAIGIGGMEELIRDMATDFQNFKKELNQCSSEISEMKSHIVEESIFSSQEKSVEDVKKTYADLMEVQDLLEDSADFTRSINEITSRLNAVDSELSSLLELDAAWTSYSSCAHKHALLMKARSLIEEIQYLEESSKMTGELISLMDDLSQDDLRLNILKKALEVKNLLEAMSPSYDCNEMSEDLNNLMRQKEKIESAEESLEQARDLYKKWKRAEIAEGSSSEKLKDAEASFQELKKKLGVCPLCGGDLQEPHSHKIE